MHDHERITTVRHLRTLLTPLAVAALLVLAGCNETVGGVASQGGTSVANGARSAGTAAGNAAQNAAIYHGKLVAAGLVALLGMLFLRWLWKSAQFKYLLFGAIVVWITYAVASRP